MQLKVQYLADQTASVGAKLREDVAMSDKHSSLTADFQAFESRRKEWSREHDGKYVVMHKGEVVGFFDDYGAGLRAGIARFGAKTEFLIQQVCEEEPVFVIY